MTVIAWRTGGDRKTARKYIERGLELPAYRPRQAGRPNKIAPFVDYAGIDLCLSRSERHASDARDERRCASRARFLAAIRPQEQVRPFEVRFESPAGYQAQVDFARFVTEFTDAPGTMHCLAVLASAWPLALYFRR
ncbi:MAG: hypothetical protein EOS23_30870 [Mesorhizobium sp.]|nr:MAG: hypothetical protein EOS23_30870 [Mesorhizobium sp.]TIU10295.1 MAG: hypothetical protein E5W39_00850 [Mesorhizobium sp.]TIV85364.1 MAG: hypothetical protein E5V64_00630 [Mesorhizobium sp.]